MHVGDMRWAYTYLLEKKSDSNVASRVGEPLPSPPSQVKSSPYYYLKAKHTPSVSLINSNEPCFATEGVVVQEILERLSRLQVEQVIHESLECNWMAHKIT